MEIKLHHLLNATAVSGILAGNPDSIRTERIPAKYHYQIQELNEIMESWCNKYNIANISAPKPRKQPESIERPITGFVSVEMKQGIFNQVKGEPNIYYNGKCYQFKKYANGSFWEEYFMTLEDSINCREMMK